MVLEKNVPLEELDRHHPIRGYRRVGDRYTWIIPLNSDKVGHKSETSDSVIECASFGMSLVKVHTSPNNYNNNQFARSLSPASTHHYKIRSRDFRAETLQYTYTISKAMIKQFREMVTGTMLSDLQKIEQKLRFTSDQRLSYDRFWKLVESQRVESYSGNCQIGHHISDVPRFLWNIWGMHDEEVLSWCLEWEKRDAGFMEIEKV